MSSTSLGSETELTALDNVLWGSGQELRRGDTKGTLMKVHVLYFSSAILHHIYSFTYPLVIPNNTLL